MSKIRERGEKIRQYILKNVEAHPSDISSRTAARFKITRQAVNKHLKNLVAENALVEEGVTRSKKYKLRPLGKWRHVYEHSDRLAEDVVWRQDVLPHLGPMPDNVMEIWEYGFTEIFNNAIDHSDSPVIGVHMERTAVSTEIVIFDEGVGIFRKIKNALGLLDERHAVLELSKGKLTTDPDNHTGEGIFFSSRMFDSFQILSGETCFSHDYGEPEDWILEQVKSATGTAVWMKLNNHTARDMRKVFDQYTSDPDEPRFTKTVVPVRLAQYGDDRLVSRSQAKRLLARVDRFKTVIFDFTDVDTIGQAFSDEIFRVFANKNPEMELIPFKANPAIERMIKRVRG